MMQDFEEIKRILEKVTIILNAMKQKKLGEEDIENLRVVTEQINVILYHYKKLRFQKEYDLNIEEEYYAYIGEMESLLLLWNQSLEHRVGKKIDVEFWDTYEYFKYVDENVIYQMVMNYFMSLPEGLRLEFLSLPQRYGFLQNKIDYTKNDFSLIVQYIEMMANEVEKYKWLYEHLADYRSKAILNGIIKYWFTFNTKELYSFTESMFPSYYDLDILECDENTVMVDCGAYDGDSAESFIYTYRRYKRIYAYELTPLTYQMLEKNMSIYPNVISIQKGISAKSGTVFVTDIGSGEGNKISDAGDTAVEITTLDEDIKEPISVIKMDIEGAEKDALMGTERHIKQEKPKLLISAYHLPEDIFEIPYMIYNMRDDYKFYLRYSGDGGIWPHDYILFAV